MSVVSCVVLKCTAWGGVGLESPASVMDLEVIGSFSIGNVLGEHWQLYFVFGGRGWLVGESLLWLGLGLRVTFASPVVCVIFRRSVQGYLGCLASLCLLVL